MRLLVKEKEFSRQRDELARLRRALPWERVDNQYVFVGADGPRTLTELFGDYSQLIVYHFMFAPEWDEGCPHCSFWADNFNPNIVHLNARDVSFVAISRAPYPKLAAYKARMGWSFDWLSSSESTFNFDYCASFTPEEQASEGFYNYRMQAHPASDIAGVSVFHVDAHGSLFHTYSTYARGIDLFNTAYNYLDIVPRGRDEDGRKPQFWVRRHDTYPAD
jgi:predicted dithiol-disulfide oxidoreductase (DUF899 family)